MRIVPACFALAMALATPPLAHAAPCAPVVHDAWVRMTPTMPMGAGFFVIENPCRVPVTLVGADSPGFADVSMHESRLEQGMSRMRPLARVEIAAGGRAVFAPGGRHLMLMSPAASTLRGGDVRIELRLSNGRRLPVDFAVRRAQP